MTEIAMNGISTKLKAEHIRLAARLEERVSIETVNDGNDNHILLLKNDKQYSRDSFDRFDRFDTYFCERVFTYLSLKDCFKYECVSKLWSSLVFGQQKGLDMGLLIKQISCAYDSREIRYNTLNLAIKKYPHIDDIVVSCYRINDRFVDMIRECVHSLKSIVLKNRFMSELSDESWLLFCEEFGPHLQRFIFDYKWRPEVCADYEDKVNTLFQFTPNLIECQVERLNQCISCDADYEEFLPKLKTIKARFSGENDFQMFANQYFNRVEELCINAPQKNEVYLYMFVQLSRLEKLKTLSIDFNLITDHRSV